MNGFTYNSFLQWQVASFYLHMHNTIALNFKLYLGVYLVPRAKCSPPTNEEVTNPAYHTITDDDHCKEPVERPIGYYAEVIIPTPQVKMTPNPAYAVP